MSVYTWIYHPIRSQQWLPICCICDDPVLLERSKTDEYGQAVHEECYVLKVCSKVEVLKNGGSAPSPANKHGILQPYNAAMAETWRSPISRQPAVFAGPPMQQAKRINRLKRPWNVALTAVVAVLLTSWIAYSNLGPTSLLKFSALQKFVAPVGERPPSGHTKIVSAKGTPNLQTTLLRMKDARGTRTRLRRFGENGVDYVKEDVTVRYFTHTLPPQTTSVGESQVAYIGADVTVHYFSPKPAGRSATTPSR